MGNCMHRSAVSVSRESANAWRSSRIAIGKNQPLKRGPIRWCSPQPLFPSQLQQKREEFWDTAPAFEGRQEIWDALRSAADAAERGDHELAQAIIDSANIILPTGTLAECYDELGMRYQLPIFVLSKPSNLQSEPPPPPPPSSERPKASTTPDGDDGGASGLDRSLDVVAIVNIPSSAGPQPAEHLASEGGGGGINISSGSSSTSSSSGRDSAVVRSRQVFGGFINYFRVHLRRMRKHRTPRTSGSGGTGDGSSGCARVLARSRKKRRRFRHSGDGEKEELLDLRLRLSTGQEYQITVNPSVNVILDAKKALSKLINWQPDRQRWFCCGMALKDNLRISDCHIPPGFVIQVIVHSPLDPESNWIKADNQRPQN
ncbi:Ubiquitin domain-containing protein 2 [Sparganum proliferum]